MDPSYARDLLARSGREQDRDGSADAFVKGWRTKDSLAEQLGEEFIETATTGEDEGEDVFDQQVDEESGGPFVKTTGAKEFARGTDASNPRGAKREPFPKT